MNTDHLRYFQLAYTQRNFSEAARQAFVSHQALTKGIRALEKELGVDLFGLDETSGRPAPTEAAHALFEFAAVYDSNARLLDEEIARIRGDETATVRLGCCPGVLGALGPEFVTGFEQAYPQVKVLSWEAKDDLCEAGLRTGDYDLALVTTPVDHDCEARVLYRSPVYLWLRRDHPLAARATELGRLAPEDLQGCGIATPGKGFKCYDQLMRVLGERGVEPGEVYEMSEIFRIYGYAVDGHGLGFSNGTLVDLPAFSHDPDVMAVPIEGFTWGIAVERLATHALGKAEELFWNWARSFARKLPRNDLAL